MVDPPMEDYRSSREYKEWVAELAQKCECDGPVCGGLLAGGLCDQLRDDDRPFDEWDEYAGDCDNDEWDEHYDCYG